MKTSHKFLKAAAVVSWIIYICEILFLAFYYDLYDYFGTSLFGVALFALPVAIILSVVGMVMTVVMLLKGLNEPENPLKTESRLLLAFALCAVFMACIMFQITAYA